MASSPTEQAKPRRKPRHGRKFQLIRIDTTLACHEQLESRCASVNPDRPLTAPAVLVAAAA
jgi:hypothetical protein